MRHHITKKPMLRYYPSGESITVKAGKKLEDSETRVTVVDEDSFNRALELMASGPVIVSTKYKSYIIKDFDQAAEIVSDQLAGMKVTIVEAYQEPTKPAASAPTWHKPAPYTGPAFLVRVYDERTFEKALELITEGPVTVEGKEVTDFDEAAELITNILLSGKHPIVKKVEKE